MTDENTEPIAAVPQPAKSGSRLPIAIIGIVAIVAVLVLAIVLMGGPSESLVGYWDVDTYSEMDVPMQNLSGFIEFRENGTATLDITYDNIHRVSNFNWTESGSRIVIGGVTGSYEIDGDTLTLSCNFWDLSATKSN